MACVWQGMGGWGKEMVEEEDDVRRNSVPSGEGLGSS